MGSQRFVQRFKGIQQMKTYKFTVIGKGRFPLDMLRYDACWPQSTEDGATISMSLDKECRELRPASGWQVQLMGVNPATAARWSSFGWTVAGNGAVR
jgi:hypothetical protein